MSEFTANRKHIAQKLALLAGAACVGLMMTGCDLGRNQLKPDRSGNKEFQDYRDGLAPRIPTDEDLTWGSDAAGDDGIPALQAYVAQPSENLRPMPLVSVSVNQTVPLRDVLFDLAEQAEYDIELDPRISGSIIFTARERPFDLVIKRISEIAGLRYKFDDGSLRVELDTPYHQTYKIDYLSFIRTNSSSIRNDVTVSAGGSANTGSKFEASATSEANFWGELESSLAQILGVGPSSGNLRTTVDPQITAVAQNPNVQPVATVGEDGQPVVQVAPPQTTLQVSPLPTANIGNANAPAQQGGGQGPSFAANRQAGVISIYATERQHEKIREYLKELRRSVTAQVLIEAKILEVSLTDEFSAGIDWSQVSLLSGELTMGLTSGARNVVGGVRPILSPEQSLPTNFRVGYSGNDIGAIVDAVSRFGTVHALASPRLTVLNNQSAVLNVANNQVYFELDVDVSTSVGAGAGAGNLVQTTVDSQIQNVPEGVLINVQPSIDLDNRTVSMAVRPTVTRIARYVPDPAVAFIAAQNNLQIESRIPVLNVQEMDSVVRMNSGQAIVMGGLMQDRAESTQQGVPVLSEIPLFGAAFRNTGDRISKTELVVFLKATIIDGANGTADQTDKDLYNKFSGDRRPLNL